MRVAGVCTELLTLVNHHHGNPPFFQVGIALVLIVASAPVMMVYFQMTQDQRDRVDELRRREREVQNEEMMNQIKAL